MTTTSIRQPGLVALRSRVWVEEIASELVRLGHDQGEAEKAARTMLAHIVGRAQWPRAVYLADERAALEEGSGG